MATPAGQGPVGRAPKANAAKGKSWVASHKALVVGMFVVLLGLYYLVRRHAAATAAAATTTDTTGGANSGFAVPAASLGMSGDPTAGGFIDPNSTSGLLTQLLAGQAGLADTLSGLTGAQGTSSGAAAATTSPAATTGTSTSSSPATTGTSTSSSPAVTTGTSTGNGTAHKTTPTPVHSTAKPPPAKKAATKPTPHTYTVKRGDSLASIASRLHIAGGWQKLYSENRKAVGTNPNLIHAGLVLHF